MKRVLSMVLLLCILLCGCGGDVRHAERTRDPSERYNQKEIDRAMDVVERFFRKEFAGCVLEELIYDNGFSEDRAPGWEKQYGEEEAIVILSVFSVDGSGGDGSLTPNSTYRNYQWILTRSGNGEWELRTWGYG